MGDILPQNQSPRDQSWSLGQLSFLPHSLKRYHFAPALLWRVGRLRGSGCRGGFHEAADLLCRTSLHIVGDVRVGVQSEPGAVVAQHAGQGLHIHAAGDRHRGECMSQIVETHMLLDACVFQQLPVDPRHGIRTPVAACPGRREQDRVRHHKIVFLCAALGPFLVTQFIPPVLL